MRPLLRRDRNLCTRTTGEPFDQRHSTRQNIPELRYLVRAVSLIVRRQIISLIGKFRYWVLASWNTLCKGSSSHRHEVAGRRIFVYTDRDRQFCFRWLSVPHALQLKVRRRDRRHDDAIRYPLPL